MPDVAVIGENQLNPSLMRGELLYGTLATIYRFVFQAGKHASGPLLDCPGYPKVRQLYVQRYLRYTYV